MQNCKLTKMLRRGRPGVALAALLLAVPALATDYTAEYERKIKASQNVGVLGNDLAGDRVNFYTGSTSFSATDLSVPGNATAVSITRTFVVEHNHMLAAVKGTLTPYEPELYSARLRLFGDWDLDVPHISTTMSKATGWVVDSTTPANRCSLIGQRNAQGADATGRPPTTSGTRGWPFPAYKYWSGYTLHAGGDQPLLLAPANNIERPSGGGPYHWTTNQNWWVSCLSSTANNAGGEAFLVRSPDGATYTFDWLSKRTVDSVTDKEENKELMPGFYPSYLFRAEYKMLPTRIVDRFGNWTSYAWSNDEFARLLSVTTGPVGSTTPEQTIAFSYNAQGLISQISDGTRVWQYVYSQIALSTPLDGEYNSYTLSQVILPDSSKWQYSLGGVGGEAQLPVCTIDPEFDPDGPEYRWACWGGGDVQPIQEGGTIIHPSGASVTFTFTNHFQSSLTTTAAYVLGLNRKEISGVGLSNAVWKYDYLMTKDESRAACWDPNIGCPNTVVTDQVNPDNSITRRVFGLTTATETMLLAEFDGSIGENGGGSPVVAPGNALETAVMAKVSPTAGVVPTWYRKTSYTRGVDAPGLPYLVKVGVNPVHEPAASAQAYASERRLPTVKQDLTQQGVVFTSETTLLDKYARPLAVSRRSAGAVSGNVSRIDEATYADNTSLWVLGQVATTRQAGKLVSSTAYHPATALPTSTSRFGELQQSFEYNADGTLKSVTDALNHKLSLSNWYRGVPRTIVYPTAVSESATVATDGSILSTTDELSSTTTYGYDSLGRLNSIAYPIGDTVTWNSLSRTLAPHATAEYGVPAGHWKQVVQTGSGTYGRTTTIYDARWQPVLTVTEDTANAASKSFVVRRFDAMGRETFRSYPVASATVDSALTGIVTEYDALGRPVKTKQDAESASVLTTTSEYLTGFQTRVTNPRGKSTTTSYQVLDAPSMDAPVRIDAPLGVTTVISRDLFGKPLQITRSGPGAEP